MSEQGGRERVTLRDLVEQRFDAMEKRLDAMNEIRGALKDQANKMRSRDECDVIAGKITEDVRSLRESRSMLEGKASQLSVNITLAIAIIGLAVSTLALFVR